MKIDHSDSSTGSTCHGLGGRFVYEATITCPECGGSGSFGIKQCHTCYGEGFIEGYKSGYPNCNWDHQDEDPYEYVYEEVEEEESSDPTYGPPYESDKEIWPREHWP